MKRADNNPKKSDYILQFKLKRNMSRKISDTKGLVVNVTSN